MTPEGWEGGWSPELQNRARYGNLKSGRMAQWNKLGVPALHRVDDRKLPPKLADLEASSLEGDSDKEESSPRREPTQPDIPVRKQTSSADKSESLSTGGGIAQGAPEQSTNPSVPSRDSSESMQGYDARDAEISKTISGMKQEKFRREKKQSDQGMQFAKAGAAFVGRMLGGAIGKGTSGIPSELKSALGSTIGEMFGGSADASVSSEESGGQPGNADMGVKLDRIIELLSQLVQATGKNEVAGPQLDESIASGAGIGQTIARQGGNAAVQAVTGASINESNKSSSSDDMMTVFLQTLMKVAIAAI